MGSRPQKRDFPLLSLLSRACADVQRKWGGLKLAKNRKTAEKELCLLLLAMRQML